LISENTKGAFLISLAAACYVMSDIFMKFLSSEISMFQITFLRGLLVTFFLFSYCYMSEASFFIKEWRDRIVITIRSILEVIMTYTFLAALFNMNVANANAILQLIPLMVLLGSFIFLRQSPKTYEWIAVLVGCFGAVIIIRPGASDFNFFTIHALVAVFCLSARDLLTVRLNKNIPSNVVAFYSALMLTVVSFLLNEDTDLFGKVDNSLFIVYTAIFVSIGYIASVSAMRYGEVTFVSPFRYTALLWASVMGFIFFGEIPKFSTLFGGSLIILAGIFIFYKSKDNKKTL
jgi:S-adenosylmethionine uptake transporter